ncbi:uncharacterized protein il17rb [Pholidichthys leucotaenia]
MKMTKEMVMWGLQLIFFSYSAAAQEVKCEEDDGFPRSGTSPPSILADLKVELLTDGNGDWLNISWAVKIDASIEDLKGTQIRVQGEMPYLCEYNPPLHKTNLDGIDQKWFHDLVPTSCGHTLIEAANVPLPPLGSKDKRFKNVSVIIPCRKGTTTKSTTVTTVQPITEPTAPALTVRDITSIIFGGVVGLMILGSCCMIYRNFCSNISKWLGFKSLPPGSVPVLVVYPAKDLAFQQAVLALAEFLQWHGGCSVAIDMWQQGKIAELGPIRWLAEQANTVERVLIVHPKEDNLNFHPLYPNLPEPSIPAAAHDLYPMILNMVASHAKSTSELAKFWVVQLGQDKKSCILPLELRVCKIFGLMKDLGKLCRSIHGQNKTMLDVMLRQRVFYNKNSTLKLREAVQNLRRHQPGTPKQPLKSIITNV